MKSCLFSSFLPSVLSLILFYSLQQTVIQGLFINSRVGLVVKSGRKMIHTSTTEDSVIQRNRCGREYQYFSCKATNLDNNNNDDGGEYEYLASPSTSASTISKDMYKDSDKVKGYINTSSKSSEKDSVLIDLLESPSSVTITPEILQEELQISSLLSRSPSVSVTSSFLLLNAVAVIWGE